MITRYRVRTHKNYAANTMTDLVTLTYYSSISKIQL